MAIERVAVYPGSYDPLTNGHLDIIRRGLNLFDRIIVAVLVNPAKTHLFSLDERLQLLNDVFAGQPGVEIDHFDGLLIDFVHRHNATALVRGLRAISDFEIEFQMALMNRQLDPGVDTLFLVPSVEFTFLSSRLVKEIYQLGGEAPMMVPEIVHRRLQEKFRAPRP